MPSQMLLGRKKHGRREESRKKSLNAHAGFEGSKGGKKVNWGGGPAGKGSW